MVCLHGLADVWHAWKPVLGFLEAHHEVIALALPGHAEGAPLPENGDLRVPLLADAIERDLDAAGVTRAHLVGNSLGGWLSLELASRGRALSVVAISPAGGWYRGSVEERRVARFFRRTYIRARRVAPRADFVARLPMARVVGLRDVVSRPLNVPVEEFARRIRGVAGSAAVPAALAVLQTEGWEDPLDRIGCPVRIAWGTRDRILPYPAAAVRFRDLVPGAEYQELDGLGHVPMSDDPELVASAIRAVTVSVDRGIRPT